MGVPPDGPAITGEVIVEQPMPAPRPISLTPDSERVCVSRQSLSTLTVFCLAALVSYYYMSVVVSSEVMETRF